MSASQNIARRRISERTTLTITMNIVTTFVKSMKAGHASPGSIAKGTESNPVSKSKSTRLTSRGRAVGVPSRESCTGTKTRSVATAAQKAIEVRLDSAGINS